MGKVNRGGYSSKRRWQLGREALLELDQEMWEDSQRTVDFVETQTFLRGMREIGR